MEAIINFILIFGIIDVTLTLAFLLYLRIKHGPGTIRDLWWTLRRRTRRNNY